ncbi:hypothetical protein DF40_013340 [Stenotrophomonas maltophilia M30]|nr:hypothetical protein DF40_013340 [Stenotrophomonas maltophilia M30]
MRGQIARRACWKCITYCRHVRGNDRAAATESFHSNQSKPFLISVAGLDEGSDERSRTLVVRGKRVLCHRTDETDVLLQT